MIDLLLHNLRTIGTHHCDGTVGEEAADEIERLRAEVAGLREDAERYRHMRNNSQFQSRNGPGLYWCLPRYGQGDEGEQLDAAIDAARTGEAC